MRIFQSFSKLHVILIPVIYLFSFLQASAEETGLMLCTAGEQSNSSYIVFQPDLLNKEKECDGRDQSLVAGKKQMTMHGLCAPVNIACLSELTPGFEQTISHLKSLTESGQPTPKAIMPLARSAGIRERAIPALVTFLIASQLYLYWYSSTAAFYDTLAVSLAAAGVVFIFPNIAFYPSHAWYFVQAWLNPSEDESQTPTTAQSQTPRGAENYGSSSNTVFGKSSSSGVQVENFHGNMHKLKFQ